MAHPHQEEEEKIVQKVIYDKADLLQFESPNKLSSIGKMVLSTKTSAPTVSFGTSTRAKQNKLFINSDFAKTQFFGKTSPGPNYEVRDTDKFYYKDEPKWSFSKTAKNCLDIAPKHAYYLRDDIDFDPMTSDNSRRWNAGVAKIGLESRFSDNVKKNKQSPGPDYNPNLRPEIPSSPQFSLGIRREVKGASPLILMASTPKEIGPGSYLPLKLVTTSKNQDGAKVGFTKAEKLQTRDLNIQGNQTYDTRSCLGEQITSKNRSMSQISIGKTKRDAFVGVFKDMMATQQTSIRIQHRY
jgi:hypothetical protein